MLGQPQAGKMPFLFGLSPAKMAFFLSPESAERLRRGWRAYYPSHAALAASHVRGVEFVKRLSLLKD